MNEQQILNFIKKKSQLPKLIVIYWPTASWKTALSLKVAELIDSEIISADSRQIYKQLNIWTWKITKEEMNSIIHYMIDIIDIDKDYSVWEYKQETEKIIEDISKKWKIPVICWWTWLYIDSIIYNFKLPEVEADWEFREKMEKLRLEKWNEYLWEMLNKVDSDYATSLSPNNYRYVMRWLEVFEKTWKSKLELKQKNEVKYDILFMTPYNWDRQALYNKINSRIDEMFKDGLLDEVKDILKKYPKDSFWLNTIWYKEVIDYLDWNISFEECVNMVKQHNRNYAKRQLTWFRKYES